MNVGRFGVVMAEALLVLIPLILSLSVHECAHAWAARRLGDGTAERAGRLTLNPLAHIDPVGTVALPLMVLLAQGGLGASNLPFFGWAKPTPVNPNHFTRKITARRGSTLVALAGPVSNFVLGFICALCIVALRTLPCAYATIEPLEALCLRMIFINAGLAVFNLLPLHPLDGETVLAGLLPPKFAEPFETFNLRYGTYALWAVVLFGRSWLTGPMVLVARAMLRVVTPGL